MVTLKGIIMSLKTTNDFFGSVMMSVEKKPRYIEFKNGFKDVLSWSEYLTFRQLAYSGFKVHRIDAQTDLEYYERIGFSLPVYSAEKKGYRIMFDKSMFVVLGEPIEKEYALDVAGKNVLDVGAYKGETAVWFKIMGADNLVLYEPAKENIPILKLNLSINQIGAEVHEEGVSDHDGQAGQACINVSQDSARRTKVRNVSDVIQDSNCDVAKFDCEGAELSLTEVDGRILRMLEGYEIECHSFRIRDSIKKKFIDEGFKLTSISAPDTACMLEGHAQQTTSAI